MEMRGKQFQLLLYALQELHAELYDDDQEENERAAKRAREEEEAKARAEAVVQAEAAEVVVLDAGDREADEREDRSQPTRPSLPDSLPKEEDGEVEEGAVEPMDASG